MKNLSKYLITQYYKNIHRYFITKAKSGLKAEVLSNEKIIPLKENEKKFFAKTAAQFVHTDKTNIDIVLNKLFVEKNIKKEMAEIDHLYNTIDQQDDDITLVLNTKVIETKVNQKKLDSLLIGDSSEVLSEPITLKAIKTPLVKSRRVKNASPVDNETRVLKNKMAERERLERTIVDDERESLESEFDISEHIKRINIKQFTKGIKFTCLHENVEQFNKRISTLSNKRKTFDDFDKSKTILQQYRQNELKNSFCHYLYDEKFFSLHKQMLTNLTSTAKALNPKTITIIFHLKKNPNKEFISMIYIICDNNHIATIAINLGLNTGLISLDCFQVFFVFLLANLLNRTVSNAKLKILSSKKGQFEKALVKPNRILFHNTLGVIAQSFLKRINSSGYNDIIPNLTTYDVRAKLGEFLKTLKKVDSLEEREIIYLYK
jgi:hypothetical protein